MTFNELGLVKPIVRAITAEGYETPTPIQAKALPIVIDGRDVLGCAQTGTGKTGAFAMPILMSSAMLSLKLHVHIPCQLRQQSLTAAGRKAYECA